MPSFVRFRPLPGGVASIHPKKEKTANSPYPARQVQMIAAELPASPLWAGKAPSFASPAHAGFAKDSVLWVVPRRTALSL